MYDGMEGGEENAGIWCPPALWKRSALAACRSGLHGVPPSCNGRRARDAIVTRCDTIVTYSFFFFFGRTFESYYDG